MRPARCQLAANLLALRLLGHPRKLFLQVDRERALRRRHHPTWQARLLYPHNQRPARSRLVDNPHRQALRLKYLPAQPPLDLLLVQEPARNSPLRLRRKLLRLRKKSQPV